MVWCSHLCCIKCLVKFTVKGKTFHKFFKTFFIIDFPPFSVPRLFFLCKKSTAPFLLLSLVLFYRTCVMQFIRKRQKNSTIKISLSWSLEKRCQLSFSWNCNPSCSSWENLFCFHYLNSWINCHPCSLR